MQTKNIPGTRFDETMPTTSVKKKSPSPEALRKAGCDYVRKQIAKIFENSQIKDHTSVYPRFGKEEVVMGKVLGEGGFGVVNEIRSIKKERLHSPSKDNYEMEEQERDFIAQHCLRDGGDARYAVKYLKRSVIDDPATFIMAIKDMAIESRLLSTLKHSNIVKMRALSTVDPYSENFFIVMDRLYDTLDKRIQKWQKKFKATLGMMSRLQDKKGLKAAALLEERIVAAYDLSSAFEYLHSHKIIYRDIKPENMGFDVRGDIKLFDFGLSKELHPDQKDKDGTYALTGVTGSTRYMAPEISQEKPYNLSCDAYSFAILFWEMLALERPFASYMPRQIRELVHNGDKRPRLHDDWDKCLKDLLEKNWSADWKRRYTFKQVTGIFGKYIAEHGNARELDHGRGRTAHVFRGKNTLGRNDSSFYDHSVSRHGGEE